MDADTLVIASGAALPHAEREVNAIVNSGLHVEVLSGDEATRPSLLAKAKRDQPWLRWWFIAHGDSGGLHLSDGVMSTSLLTQYARRAGIEFLFLNTCESERTARYVQQELDIILICTISTIDDYVAYSTGALLATELAEGNGYHDAYLSSKPGQNRDYIFLPEMTPSSRNNNSNTNTLVAANNERIARNNERIAAAEGRLSRLELSVFGSDEVDARALREEVKDLRKILTTLMQQLAEVQAKLDDQHLWPVVGWQRVGVVVLIFLLSVAALLQIFGSPGLFGG